MHLSTHPKGQNAPPTDNMRGVLQDGNSSILAAAGRNKHGKHVKTCTRDFLKQRDQANARERVRTHSVNVAFTSLRNLLPSITPDRRLSKIEILRMARSYISHLTSLLDRLSEKLDYESDSIDSDGLSSTGDTLAELSASQLEQRMNHQICYQSPSPNYSADRTQQIQQDKTRCHGVIEGVDPADSNETPDHETIREPCQESTTDGVELISEPSEIDYRSRNQYFSLFSFQEKSDDVQESSEIRTTILQTVSL